MYTKEEKQKIKQELKDFIKKNYIETVYKIYEQYGDAEIYANESGLLMLANTDRENAEKITDIKKAIQTIEQEKLVNTEITDFKNLEQVKDFLIMQDIDFKEEKNIITIF